MPERTSSNDRVTDRKLDEAVDESFPASDPPAHSGVTGVRRPTDKAAGQDPQHRPPSHERDDDARPTGQPTSDRHATETAHGWESDVGVKAEKE